MVFSVTFSRCHIGCGGSGGGKGDDDDDDGPDEDKPFDHKPDNLSPKPDHRKPDTSSASTTKKLCVPPKRSGLGKCSVVAPEKAQARATSSFDMKTPFSCACESSLIRFTYHHGFAKGKGVL